MQRSVCLVENREEGQTDDKTVLTRTKEEWGARTCRLFAAVFLLENRQVFPTLAPWLLFLPAFLNCGGGLHPKRVGKNGCVLFTSRTTSRKGDTRLLKS